MNQFFGIDLVTLIQAVGYAGIFAIVYAESGLFIGFVLPGDSLLFTAGFLAAQNYLSLPGLMFISFAGAVLGDNFGYTFGRKIGPRLFTREHSLLFNKDHLERTRQFYERHGAKTLVLARFMPVVRTFAPILAGVGRMRYGPFLLYNFIGAAAWGMGLPALGYFLGRTIPNADVYLPPIVGLIVFFSILPGLIHLTREKNYRQQLGLAIRKIFAGEK